MIAAMIAPGPIDPQAMADAERVIDRSLKSYVELGQGLRRLADLFGAGRSKQFEAHALKCWGLARTTVYELMQAAAIALQVRKPGLPPASKEVAMMLAPLQEEERGTFWRELTKSVPGRLTAAVVAAAVQARLGRPYDALPGERSDEDRILFGCLPPEEQIERMTTVQSPIRTKTGERDRMAAAERKVNALIRLHQGEPEVADEGDFILMLYRRAVIDQEPEALVFVRRLMQSVERAA